MKTSISLLNVSLVLGIVLVACVPATAPTQVTEEVQVQVETVEEAPVGETTAPVPTTTLDVLRVQGVNAPGDAMVFAQLTPAIFVSSAKLLINGEVYDQKEAFQAGEFQLALDQNELSLTDVNNLAIEVATADGTALTAQFTAKPSARSVYAESLLNFYFLGEGLGWIPLDCNLGANSVVFAWSVPFSGHIGVVPALLPQADASHVSVDFWAAAQRNATYDLSATIAWLPNGPTVGASSARFPYYTPSTAILRAAETGQNWWFVPGQGKVVVTITPLLSLVEGNVPGTPRDLEVHLLADYTVILYTGKVDGAGTDADVLMTLHGDSGSSIEYELDNPNIDEREYGYIDTYYLYTEESIGDLHSVRIRHDNSGDNPGWYLEKIVVRHPESGREWVFLWNEWLATGEADGRIDHTISRNTYIITLYTGEVSGAGTDADVFITLSGNSGTSIEYELDNPNVNDREFGSEDIYRLSMMQDLGNLEEIRIWHNNSGDGPGWFLEQVLIRHLETNEQWVFSWNGWFATDEGDEKIDRVLRAE